MVIPEWDETFVHDTHEFQGIFTEFDQDAPAGHPGMVTRVLRLLALDEDADKIPEGAILTRLKTGESFEIKTPRRSGVGLTELDMARVNGKKFERTF